MKFFKNIWLHAFKAYLALGLFFYYRRIRVHDVENIPKNESVLILSNHQNALLDALLIATKSPRFVYFLTRASVFKKPIVQKFLKSLQMLPVYRIRDGWNNLPKNTEIFQTCTEHLNNREAVVIFPEGSHNLMRTVRPLSKGFTRIVFDTLQSNPSTQLKLLPVGLNFENAVAFKDSVSIYFGEPFLANDYLSTNINESTIRLKEDVQKKISELTTHVPSENYEEIIKKLTSMKVDFLNPKQVNDCIAHDFNNCPKRATSCDLINALFKSILCGFLIGPYLLWKFYILPKIDEREFTGTFRFAVAAVLVPIWVLILCALLVFFFNWIVGLSFLFFILLFALVTIKL